ncbi:SDR family oxidoreductase [Streptomyces bottropensis]
MTRVAALEYATQNIRVNAVAPGVTHTPILDNAPADLLEMLAGQAPQGPARNPAGDRQRRRLSPRRRRGRGRSCHRSDLQ